MRIAIVGVCASGKTTLVAGLRAAGYDAYNVAQEHSCVHDFWAKKNPDMLVMIDARPSDAIALAVRLNCDLYAYESVMEEAGIVMEDTEKETNLQNTEDTSINKVPPTTSLDLIPLDELEDMLQEAIDDEDYQKAAQIRDEINKRK